MAPDPRRVRTEPISPVNGSTLNENLIDNLDVVPEGYTLFTSEPGVDGMFDEYTYTSDVTDDDENEEEENDNEDSDNAEETNTRNGGTIEQNISGTNEEITDCTSSSDLCVANRPDIAIDCDKIKAAMVGFTLPPSNIPAWATAISDLDISSHVDRILNKTDK